MKAMKVNFRKNISNLDKSLDNKSYINQSLSMFYHENSKFTRFELMKQGIRIERFSNPFVNKRASQPYKAHPTSKTFSIKEYEDTDFKADIFNTILSRRSRRTYRDYAISLNEIGKLLYFSYGITGKEKMNDEDHFWHFRAVPSGGGLYPLEIYMYLNNSVLPKGIYHYRPDISSIELIAEGEQMEVIKEIVYAEPIINITKCSCLVFITSVFGRNLIKYGDRGYRLILQEVGSLSQNMSLICEALHLASCMAGGYIDNKVNDLLMVDGTLETIQNIIVIGKTNS